MQRSIPQETVLTIILSSVLLLFFVCLLTYFFFRQQKKRFQHAQEVSLLRESFNEIILQSKLEIQDRTLDHIAKELHANFSHLVSLININLSAILAQSSEAAKEHIVETKMLAKQLMADLKALSLSLNADVVMKAGFNKSLENELARLTRTRRFEVLYSQSGEIFRLPPAQEIVLFRLCQEILNNIVKHSQAANVTVDLNYSGVSLTLRITDDGVGFDAQKARERNLEKESTGLLNIASRAKLIQAEIIINSNPGMGTEVKVVVPLIK